MQVRDKIISSLVVLTVFIIDLITKNFILKSQEIYYLFDGFITLHFVKNTGIAFGFFKGYNNFFLFLNSFILILLFYLKRKIKKRLSFYGIHFIIGGAIGNIYDRIRHGYVIDFIDLRFFPAVFNFADFFITVGIILIFIDDFLKLKEAK